MHADPQQTSYTVRNLAGKKLSDLSLAKRWSNESNVHFFAKKEEKTQRKESEGNLRQKTRKHTRKLGLPDKTEFKNNIGMLMLSSNCTKHFNTLLRNWSPLRLRPGKLLNSDGTKTVRHHAIDWRSEMKTHENSTNR